MSEIEKVVGDDSVILGNKEVLDETTTGKLPIGELQVGETESDLSRVHEVVEEQKKEVKVNEREEKKKVEVLEKEDDVIGTISITVFRGKRCDIKLEGDKLTGQYIMRAKNNLTKSYLQWIKQRRKN